MCVCVCNTELSNNFCYRIICKYLTFIKFVGMSEVTEKYHSHKLLHKSIYLRTKTKLILLHVSTSINVISNCMKIFIMV